MQIPVRIEPSAAELAGVEYQWDADTDILSARVRHPVSVGDASVAGRSGGSTALELEGADGSWLILDVRHGQIAGVEVAVWPDVQKRPTLAPPGTLEDACVVVGAVERGRRVAVEVETRLSAEADRAERTIHFRLGASRETRTVRVARELLIDIDRRDRIAGLWLLDVPPFPAES